MSEDYYTHRKYLKAILQSFDYSKEIKVLEFGVGDGSSLIFNEFCKAHKNLKVFAYESNLNWYEITKEKYQLSNYEFTHLDDLNCLSVSEDICYDLIFIDQSPWESRIKTIDSYINNCKYMILHDYDYYNKGVCDNIYSVDDDSYFSKYLNNNRIIKGKYESLPPTMIIECVDKF